MCLKNMCAATTVYLTLVCTFLYFPQLEGAQGSCHERGVFLQNGTIWHPEPCIQCQCHSSVTACNEIQCPVLQCSTDQQLISLPQECCPKCVPKLQECVESEMQFKHGASWSLSPCVDCQCYNGTISCERTQCQMNGCPEGHRVHQSPGECCPTCVSPGRQCKVDSSVYNDGEIWSTVPCTQCQCQNGMVQCYVAQCQSISCPLNYTKENNGKCCPTCVGKPCVIGGDFKQSGSRWQEDSCTHCSCVAGRVSCYKEVCSVVTCAKHQREVNVANKCCPTCVDIEGWCSLEDGTMVPPGSEVEVAQSSCPENEEIRCACENGVINCQVVMCQRTSCGNGMRLLEQTNATVLCRCPKCVPDLKMCYYDRRSRRDGEIWAVDCRLFGCFDGEISFFAPNCPTCPEGFYSKFRGDAAHSSCCPECLPLTCASTCLNCSPLSGKEHVLAKNGRDYNPVELNGSSSPTATCRVCRDGYLLQNGQCVETCSPSMFARSGLCLPCHHTCLTCSENTPVHCNSCRHPLLLRGGECIDDCGGGFYPVNDTCQPCHTRCQECVGKSATDCQVCQRDAKLLDGSCVDECPEEYVAREGVCEKCSDNCKRCGANECLECHFGLLIQNKKCVTKCPDGYYEVLGKICQACHPSCLTCSGPGISACTSCPPSSLQVDNLCLNGCPPAMSKKGNKCVACHESCSRCAHEGEDGCTRCKDLDAKILMEIKSPFMAVNSPIGATKGLTDVFPPQLVGRCVQNCPENHIQSSRVCVASATGCEQWHSADPSFCKKCSSGFVLQNDSCVKKCSPGYYQGDDDSCLECSSHCSTCSSMGSDSCNTCPPWASLHNSTVKSSTKILSRCLTKCRKRYYFYPKHKSCLACHDTCEDCATSFPSESPICVQCKDSSQFIEGEKCVSSCSPGLYFSETKNRCHFCHSQCKTCIGPAPDQCTTCSDNLTLSDEGTCKDTTCENGFTMANNNTCTTKCDPNCHSCENNDSSVCSSCPLNQLLLFGKCVDKCPKKFYDNLNGKCEECHWACKECLGPTANACTECDDAKKRQGSSCVVSCSPGFYEDGGGCYPCHGGCKHCTTAENCSACEAPYFLENGVCVLSCKERSASNVWKNICVPCNEHCEECSMSLECNKCTTPYMIQNGKCLRKCDVNNFPNLDKTKCYYNVDGPKLFVIDIKIDYGSTTVLNDSFVRVFDMDTPRENLMLIVIHPPTNAEIFILEKNQTKSKIKSNGTIKLQTLDEGRVIMKHILGSPFNSVMNLKTSDGHFESSTEAIAINVVSRFTPEILVLEPLLVRKEGKSIITNDNLKVRDIDSKEAVSIVAQHGPSAGILKVRGKEVTSFSIKDLEELQVFYEYSATKHKFLSENSLSSGDHQNTDSILFQVGDGYNYVNFLFKIIIVDSSHPTPVLVKNKGAKVQKRHKVQITKDLLQAKDVNSEDENIVYSFLPSTHNPMSGSLVLVIPLPTTLNGFFNDGWTQMDESHLLRPTTSFTQRDIDEGRVWYVHSKADVGFAEGSSEMHAQYRDVAGGEYSTDQLVFSISDSSNPPNVLKDQTFVIQIEESSNLGLERGNVFTPETHLGITVLEGQAVTITPNHLTFSGVDSSDHLVYTISHPLGPNDGSLFHIDSPGLELRQFTQSDINDLKIIYMPPLESIGNEDKIISFKFTISGEIRGKQTSLPEQKFTIRVLPLQEVMTFLNPDPEVVLSSLGTVELSPEFFQLSNMPEGVVSFFLLEAPQHGSLTLVRSGEGKQSETFTEETESTLDEILSSRVLYSNDGSDSVSDSALILALSHSSEATTRINFRIQLLDNLNPNPHKNATFVLHMHEGETKMISPKILHFTDFHSDDDELVYTLSSQPIMGTFLLRGTSGELKAVNRTDKLKQSDISNGRFSFSSNVETGLDVAVERLIFNVTDSNNNALTNQILKIVIDPMDNQPPSFTVTQKLNVTEGGSVIITPSIMTFMDIDSPLETLILVVDVPPLFGYISNSLSTSMEQSYQGNPASLLMSQYPLKDLMDGKISYIQSQHKHKEPTRDSFIVHLTDGKNPSATQEIKVLIKPTNDESPVILGEQVSVERGGTVTIQNISLIISDADTDANELIITIEQAPQHGTLHKKKTPTSSFKESVSIGKGEKFSFQNVIQEVMFYSHDGSKATKDFMEIKVSDGVQETGGILEFLVRSQVVKTPRLSTNNALKVGVGQTAVVPPSSLSATDDDSSINDLSYVINVPAQFGNLQLYDEKQSEWKTLSVGSSFLQKDVNLGRVRYMHTKTKEKEALDQVHFHLQDAEGNILLGQIFNISLEPDTNPPRVTSNRVLNISELSLTPLTADILSSTDSEVDPMTISYTISGTPTLGQFEFISVPNKPILFWTQEDLELGNVGFRHTNNKGVTSEKIKMIIADESNAVAEVFKIHVMFVDEILPYLILQPVKVQSGSTKNISQYEIKAEDPDTKDDRLIIRIKEAPQFGKIQIFDHGETKIAKSFTMRDINEGKVSYQHDGSSATSDSVMLTVTDPSNKGYLFKENDSPITKASELKIEIMSVTGGTPIIAVNMGLHYLEHSDGKAKNTITSNDLSVTDDDSSPETLSFKVTKAPQFGVLRLDTHERPISSFTQAMVNSGKLYYELTTFDETVTEDNFIFDVSDQSLNVVPANLFHIQWSWVFMVEKEYNVSEPDGIVQVFVKRTGNLNKNSSVKCSIHESITKERSKRKSKNNKSKLEKDYVPINLELDFELDSSEKFCEIAIKNDEILEGKDSFSVRLTDPKFSLIGKPKKSVVNIWDEEDRPSLSFESSQYAIQENEDFIFVPIKRKGDAKVSASVMCVTKDLTAVGSDTYVNSSNSDYVRKLATRDTSKIVFPPGVTISTCDVKLINDATFEMQESFELFLQNPSEGVTLGAISKTTVVIKGPSDMSELSFELREMEVNESSGKVNVIIKRTGVDMNHSVSVWCASRSFSPQEATPNIDFIPFAREIKFNKEQSKASFSVTLIDDKVNPRHEGPERFLIFMSTPQNASLNVNKSELIVTISDREDIPSIEFAVAEIRVKENDTMVKVPIVRSGDLSRSSSVICFTRQRSAKGGIDFTERPDSSHSIITFPIGVANVDCEIGILDDLIYENEEEFTVKLSKIDSITEIQTVIGPNKTVRVSIIDLEDKPQITFKEEVYTTAEPTSIEETTFLIIPVLRSGDDSKASKIHVTTENMSAVSGSDYQQLNQMVEFLPGSRRVELKVAILHNPVKQWNKSFKVVLQEDQSINCDLGTLTFTVVTILDHHVTEASVFPSAPVVVSLLHYDTAKEHYKEPATPGYPLVCITACEPNHPEFKTLWQLCDQAGLSSESEIKFSWEVAVPEEGNDLFSPFHTLTDSTLFANSSTKVLEPMFFASHFRVRCVVQPVLEGGHQGIARRSIPIAISSSHGICNKPGRNSMKSQNFQTKLTYINSTNSEHPNTIEISVTVPHQDGTVPLISTVPLHNVRYLLTDALYRTHHTCSNLHPGKGFLDSNFNLERLPQSGSRPYQWDFNLREQKSLNLYHHLNLSTCTWTFFAWYSMSQLVEGCGGQIVSDFQVGSGQSFLTVRVPFYLSYVYASAAPGWTSLDHRTELSVSFYYSTLLWNQGLETKPSLKAKIRITRMYLDGDGRLVIKFSTESKFRGQFVLSHVDEEGSEVFSSLIAPESLNVPFSLELIWSAATWDGPEQIWTATSNYTLQDYTGDYILQLVPCTVLSSQSYSLSDPPECTAHRPVNFTLPLAIQQIQQPLPLVYTLNTDFQLMNSPELFLTDPRKVDNLYELDYKGSFDNGQTVYGRVLWHPNQDLNSAYKLVIQRVYLCTGADGYIPKYDPTGEIYSQGYQYGCIEKSEKLKHRFLLLDREVTGDFMMENISSEVEAYFAYNFPEYDILKTYPGVDGFLLRTEGLYKLNTGYQWFLQVLYTIGPNHGPRNRRGSTIDDDNLQTSAEVLLQNLEALPSPAPLHSLLTRNGTNMRGFSLLDTTSSSSGANSSPVLTNALYYILIPVIVTTFLLFLVVTLLVRKYKNRTIGDIVIVRSMKNEREEARRKDEFRISDRCIKPSGSPMTLNSESNLQTVKVKTLAVTVRNNLEEDGTEV